MIKEQRERHLKDLLALINQFRLATGLEPLEDILKGIPRKASSCPIALSLNHDSAVTPFFVNFPELCHARALAAIIGKNSITAAANGDGFVVRVAGTEIAWFIALLDHGQLPEYVAESAKEE